MTHTYDGGTCIECGVVDTQYDRAAAPCSTDPLWAIYVDGELDGYLRAPSAAAAAAQAATLAVSGSILVRLVEGTP